jgi:hypothetical protein
LIEQVKNKQVPHGWWFRTTPGAVTWCENALMCVLHLVACGRRWMVDVWGSAKWVGAWCV